MQGARIWREGKDRTERNDGDGGIADMFGTKRAGWRKRGRWRKRGG